MVWTFIYVRLPDRYFVVFTTMAAFFLTIQPMLYSCSYFFLFYGIYGMFLSLHIPHGSLVFHEFPLRYVASLTDPVVVLATVGKEVTSASCIRLFSSPFRCLSAWFYCTLCSCQPLSVSIGKWKAAIFLHLYRLVFSSSPWAASGPFPLTRWSASPTPLLLIIVSASASSSMSGNHILSLILDSLSRFACGCSWLFYFSDQYFLVPPLLLGDCTMVRRVSFSGIYIISWSSVCVHKFYIVLRHPPPAS